MQQNSPLYIKPAIQWLHCSHRVVQAAQQPRFSSVQKDTWPRGQRPSHPQALATTSPPGFLSLWICCCFTYTESHGRRSGCPASPARYHAFKVRSHCSRQQCSIPFRDWIIFHCMATPQFVPQLMGILIVSTFSSVLWPFIYKFLSGHIFLFLWGAYLGETKMSGSCQVGGEWGREMLVEGHERSVFWEYVYLFDCTRSWLQHAGCFYLRHANSELWPVGSSSLTRSWTQAPCIVSREA